MDIKDTVEVEDVLSLTHTINLKELDTVHILNPMGGKLIIFKIPEDFPLIACSWYECPELAEFIVLAIGSEDLLANRCCKIHYDLTIKQVKDSIPFCTIH